MTDDFFTPFYYDDKDEKKAEKKLYGRRAQNLLKTDIKEKPEGYELIVDVPGFKKDEVKVALKDGYLTVSAAKGLDEDDEVRIIQGYVNVVNKMVWRKDQK